MLNPRLLAVLAAALLLGALVPLAMPLLLAPELPQPSPLPRLASSAAAAPAVTTTPLQTAPAARAAAPGDTHTDGAVREDEHGDLLIDLALRDYLDYFLSRADLVGLPRATAALYADAQPRLAPKARQQLGQLLDHYLQYKQAVLALLDAPLSAEQQHDPAAQLALLRQVGEQLQQMRRHYLGAEVAQAFFADEEAYGNYSLARMELLAGNSDPASREQALAELERQLPPAIQASRQRYAEQQQLAEQTRQLLDSPQDAQQLRGQLGQLYEPEVVERLLAERQAEQDLQLRYRDYRVQADNLRHAALASEDRQRQLDELRQQMFRADEQRRVEIMDSTPVN
ncbi:hypothetical protein A9179_03265 [Pseudomonas alcaligenes]|uniref:Lipase chaperone n=1 Tax=Aquipseudomonas alcaligenes TaxID=43263 RepID=A0ABR7RVI2_AQUAC|nr:lipase secretion chaperone [Pseudomonas alcaligenes]MBC9249291.1 hypothetical protein [Pseudomonas alcaligenes]